MPCLKKAVLIIWVLNTPYQPRNEWILSKVYTSHNFMYTSHSLQFFCLKVFHKLWWKCCSQFRKLKFGFLSFFGGIGFVIKHQNHHFIHKNRFKYYLMTQEDELKKMFVKKNRIIWPTILFSHLKLNSFAIVSSLRRAQFQLSNQTLDVFALVKMFCQCFLLKKFIAKFSSK